jgi:Family of unknown function (DUF5343)
MLRYATRLLDIVIGVTVVPVTSSAPAPYAPASAILALIRRHRERGLPTPINEDVLARCGITDSLISRTLAALVTLDLIDDQGNPTATFEGLRLAPEADYTQRIAQWLKGVYGDVLNFIDPATATDTMLEDAFRNHNPPGQRARMITLFTGLHEAAGIRPEKSSSRRASRANNPTSVNGTADRKIGKSKLIKSAAPPSLGETPIVPLKPPAASVIMDKALEYKLIDLMRDEGIEDSHREAIWTLVRYLTAKHKTQTADQT